jgi:hypothetical protein
MERFVFLSKKYGKVLVKELSRNDEKVFLKVVSKNHKGKKIKTSLDYYESNSRLYVKKKKPLLVEETAEEKSIKENDLNNLSFLSDKKDYITDTDKKEQVFIREGIILYGSGSCQNEDFVVNTRESKVWLFCMSLELLKIVNLKLDKELYFKDFGHLSDCRVNHGFPIQECHCHTRALFSREFDFSVFEEFLETEDEKSLVKFLNLNFFPVASRFLRVNKENPCIIALPISVGFDRVKEYSIVAIETGDCTIDYIKRIENL